MNEPIVANRLDPSEYQPYFKSYIDLVGEADIRDLLHSQTGEIEKMFASVDKEQANTIHKPYLWTLKQVVGHLIDGEKIFGCRAHRIACGENQPLPGYDQDVFVANSNYDNVSLADLVEEFTVIRSSNQMLFARLTPAMWGQIGICDGKNISVRAIACLLVGHVNHHLRIVEKRLGQPA